MGSSTVCASPIPPTATYAPKILSQGGTEPYVDWPDFPFTVVRTNAVTPIPDNSLPRQRLVPMSFAWLAPLYFLSPLVAGLALVAARELRPITAAIGGPGFRPRRAGSSPDFASQSSAGPNPTA